MLHPSALEEEYRRLLDGLRYAVHELPAGVLWSADSATEAQCGQLMKDLNRFEQLCRQLGHEHANFIEGCRWHFEHYAHYLSRHRHFDGYEDYIQRRNGSLRVQA